MNILDFDTGRVPVDARLAIFRAGAVNFRVDAVGDPRTFAVKWQSLKLGDLNAIHSQAAPIHYRRDDVMIESDGEDRIAIHCYLKGGATGTLDGLPAAVDAGGAMVWDLARTVDVTTTGDTEMVIVTMLRYMADEVLPVPSLTGTLAPSPELNLAVDQLRRLIDDADRLDDAAAPFLGRALRDLFAVAMLPAYFRARSADEVTAPLLRRMCERLDAAPDQDFDLAELAVALGEPVAEVRRVADHFGGLHLLIERRRLLAAYRLLCDPAEAAPVSVIAERCGFADLPRFSRRFRDVFHTTASDLRRHHSGHLPRWAGAYHVEKNYGALIAS